MDLIHVHDGCCRINGTKIVNGKYMGDTIMPYNDRRVLIEKYRMIEEGKHFDLNKVVGFICEEPGHRSNTKKDGFPTTAVDRIAEECFGEITQVLREYGQKGHIDFGHKTALINS